MKTNDPSRVASPRRLRLIKAVGLVVAVGTGGLAMHMAQAAGASPEDSGSAPSFFHHAHCNGSPKQLKAHVDKVLSDAGASDDQKQQIETVVMNAVTAEHADMKQYHETLAQLKTVLAAEPIDDSAITALRARQDQLALSLSERPTDTAATIARALTPDQRVRLSAKIDEMMSQHGLPHTM